MGDGSNNRRRRLLLAGLLIGCLIAVSVPAAGALMVCATKGLIVVPDEAVSLRADCILVLGAGLKSDGTPSDMLEDRLLQAIGLFRAGASGTILLSGDNSGKGYDEVGAMKRFALDRGIPSGNIALDNEGFSTYESVRRAREIFGARRVVVITQRYHLHRALYIADRIGLEAFGVSSDLRRYRGGLGRDVRESFARLKDFLLVNMAMAMPRQLVQPLVVRVAV